MERINSDLATWKAARRILSVQENASAEQLKRACREAAIEHHPDHNGNTAEANRRFALINCVYELPAFDKPCDGILEETNFGPGVLDDAKYGMDNPWGRFLWWRENFFDSGYNDEKQQGKGNSCI